MRYLALKERQATQRHRPLLACYACPPACLHAMYVCMYDAMWPLDVHSVLVDSEQTAIGASLEESHGPAVADE